MVAIENSLAAAGSMLFTSNFRTSPYHYTPSESVAITFIVLFGLSTALHLGQATFYRMWWLFPTIGLCGLLETLGWSGRLWSSFSPLLGAPFKIQIVATIMGPTPLLAANFVIFGILIHRLGIQYSRLSPKLYTRLFLSCDIISLVVQGVGGGMAAVESGNGLDPTKGGNIMLGGISFQFLVIIVYACCTGEFFVRYLWKLPIRAPESSKYHEDDCDSIAKYDLDDGRGEMDRKTRLMVVALCFSTLFLLIRAVYRLIELTDGWGGKIISNQVLFNVLDGAMITLAMYTMNFAHPGLLLPNESRDSKILKVRVEIEM